MSAIEQQVGQCLQALREQGASRVCVAFSGGVDSTAMLLSALASADTAGLKLSAVHVDHDLSDQSASWAQHCRQVCEHLQVALTVSVFSRSDYATTGNLEAQARTHRYSVFRREAGGAPVLFGHHLDDQGETILLRLLQGRGLHSIRAQGQSEGVWAARPLLEFSRAELETYVKAADMSWIEDPSNQDEHFLRNFLRHRVTPLLRSRWPDFEHRFVRVADAAQAQEQALRAVLAEQPLEVSWLLANAPIARPCVRAYLHNHEVFTVTDVALDEFLRQCAQDNQPRLPLKNGRALIVSKGQLLIVSDTSKAK